MITITTKKSWLIAVPLLVVGGFLGWKAYVTLTAPPPATAEPVKAAKSDTITYPYTAPQLAFLKVQVAEAFPEPAIDSLNARLDYDDNHTADIYTPLAGRVTNIIAELGQFVKAGAPLVEIDSPEFATAEAELAKAEADLANREQVYERDLLLIKSKGIAQRELDTANADLQQAQAEAERTRARLQNLGLNGVDRHFILRSPISGVVSERQVNAGTEVRPDATHPLFVITDPKNLWVIVDLPEQYLDKVKIGQTMRVEVDAYPNEFFDSKVTVIADVLDPQTRRIQVRCELVNDKPNKLKAEMFARVTPISERASELPRVPNSAIFTQGVSSYLFVELSPGVFQRRRVTLSIQGREYSFVKTGLRINERVVTTGALLLNSELAGVI
ncbi:MAG: efflux RND transporter periplasmic adaptor subunit [Gallionella sp.]|nr:efflux RND transporter periplasmic adaptor subunit [Gallionella sp.]